MVSLTTVTAPDANIQTDISIFGIVSVTRKFPQFTKQFWSRLQLKFNFKAYTNYVHVSPDYSSA